jgi:hypothetical protein
MVPKLSLLCAFALILPGIPSVYAAAPDQASGGGCVLKQYASLDVTFPPRGLGLGRVPVIINGQSTMMWLGIGSSLTLLYDGAAARLGLKARTLPAGAPEFSINGVQVSQYVNPQNFAVGGVRIEHAQLPLQSVGPMPKSLALDKAVVGVLGMDVLGHSDIELDLGHGKVNLYSTDRCGRDPVYWADRFAVVPLRHDPFNNWYVDIELDGKKIEAQLSTRGIHSSLYGNAAKALYGWDEHSPGIETELGDGKVIGLYRAMAMTAPGLSVLNERIQVLPANGCIKNTLISRDRDGAVGFPECPGSAPLSLGLDVLKKLRLYLAIDEHKAYFTTADEHK